MNKNFLPGNRVIASQGNFKGKRGEVVRSQNKSLQHGYIIKLDEEGTEEHIPERDLEAENLSPDEINAEITKLKELIKKEDEKSTDKVRKELPEHLKHLQNALKSKDKSEAENEYNYISQEIKRVLGSKLVEENISLKKIKHCWQKSLE